MECISIEEKDGKSKLIFRFMIFWLFLGVGWVSAGRRLGEAKRRGAGPVGPSGVRLGSMAVFGVTWRLF